MEEVIRGVLASHAQLGVDAATVKSNADLYRYGLTSHASINVMLAIEDAFEVEFPDTLLKRSTFQSIENIVAALSQLGVSSID